MELIEVGGFKDGVAVATEVAVALVVGDDDNHIRRLRSRRRRWQIEDKRCKSDEVVFHGGVLFFGGDSFDELFEQVGPIGGKVFDWQVAIEKITQGQTKLFDVGRMSGNQLPSKQDNKHRNLRSKRER